MNKRKKKAKMEYRYYQMPPGSYIMALLGEKWIQYYGRDIDYLHFHNYLEIGYCYEGQGTMVFGEEEQRFSGKEFTVIPKNYPHTTNSDLDTVSCWEYLFIDVEGFLQQMYKDNSIFAERMIQRINTRALFLSEEKYPDLARLVRKILDIMRNTEEFYLEEAKGVLLALLVEISRLNRKESTVSNGSGVKLTVSISRVLDYISNHYMEPIKVKELADQIHISETHFRRLFSSYMNMGPLEYVNSVRIHTACEHLQKTDESITDIAHKCGFTTSSTFNRNFKQVMGVTPMEWRKRPENYEQQLLKFNIHSEEGW